MQRSFGWLVERWREVFGRRAPTAPLDGHPSSEEWAAWASENLPEEDAAVFLNRARKDGVG